MAFVYKVQQGDELNKVVQRYGFSNYKDAGVKSVPSGNFDLIRPGDEITIGNYDPNAITGFQEGSPVVSSKDDEQGFRENSNELDSALNGLQSANDKKGEATDTGSDYDVNDDGNIESTGDPALDALNKWEQEQKKQKQKEYEKQKRDYENLYKSNLAAIDATAQASIDNINTTYDKRIKEQERINDLNIARVKAYGLSNGGQYTPISFGDAVTNREEEAADKLSGLESERNSLIRKAEAARLSGRSGALADSMEALNDLNEQIRKTLNDVESEAQAQYKLLRELRKEEEEKHQAEVEKMTTRLAAIAPAYLDDYEQMDETQKDQFIKKLSSQTGVDYATIYGILNTAQSSALEGELDIEKKKADINASNALAYQRNTAAQKNLRTGSGGDDDFSSSEEKKLEQAGLKDADRQTKLDYLYGDDIEREEALQSAQSGGGSVQQRAEAAGYDYQAMKAEGHSDEEIKAALDAAGA